MKNEAMFTSNNLNWCTPVEFFNELNDEFNFNLDAAATDKSAKCENYFTPETDGLKQTWGGVQRIPKPAIWSTYWRLGEKSIRGRAKAKHDRRAADTGQNRHKIFS